MKARVLEFQPRRIGPPEMPPDVWEQIKRIGREAFRLHYADDEPMQQKERDDAGPG